MSRVVILDLAITPQSFSCSPLRVCVLIAMTMVMQQTTSFKASSLLAHIAPNITKAEHPEARSYHGSIKSKEKEKVYLHNTITPFCMKGVHKNQINAFQ